MAIILKENMKVKKSEIDEKIKKMYLNAFSYLDDEMYYMILIGTKILQCDKSSLSVFVDIDRLFDEFRYYQYYGTRKNTYLLNFFLPLILATRSFESNEKNLIELVDKICTFYKIKEKKSEYILDLLCYDISIRNIISGNLSYIDILEGIKDKLVEYDIESLDKKDKVKFHMKKIKYIEEVHRHIDDEEYIGSVLYFNVLRAAFIDFGVSEDIDKDLDSNVDELISEDIDKDLDSNVDELISEDIDKVLNVNIDNNYNSSYDPSSIKSVLDVLSSYKNGISNSDNVFLVSMSEFLLKVRYYDISMKKYHRQEKIQNFYDMKVGDRFVDPILNSSQIISINDNINNKIRIVTIKTKTGIYNFRYKMIP